MPSARDGVALGFRRWAASVSTGRGKIMGLIDTFSGAFFHKSHTGRFNSATYEACLTEVLAKTKQYFILVQGGAGYHTSKAMQAFLAKHADRL